MKGDYQNFMDWEFIVKYFPLYKEAAMLTLKIGIIGIVLATLIGFIIAMIVYYQVPILKQVSKIYIEFSRNTPLLIQLFFIYYGLPKIGISMKPATCGVVGLAFLGGSYMAETFRSGIEAIDSIQKESAYSLGFNKLQTIIYIIMPQAIRVSLHGIVANVIFLLKETSVFSAVSIMDLMFTAKDLIGIYYNTIEALSLLVFFYLIILLPVSILGLVLERKFRYA